MCPRKIKKKKTSKTDTTPDFPLSVNGLPIYRTTRGVSLECQAIATMVADLEGNIRESIDWPDPPTYISEFGGPEGDKLELSYDEDSIVGADEETQKAWGDYITRITALEDEVDERLGKARLRLYALEGTKILDGPREEEWIVRQEYIGFTIPEDPLDRTVHFFASQCLGDVKKDIVGITMGISIASGVDEERLEAMEEGFQSYLENGPEQSEESGVESEEGSGDTEASE